MRSPLTRLAALVLAPSATVVAVALSPSAQASPAQASPAQTVDTTAPTVTGHQPGAGAMGVVVDGSVTVDFSEQLDPGSVSGLSMYLLDGSKRVPAVVSLSDDATQVVLDPSAPLRPGQPYAVHVVGGEGAVLDLAGNPLADRLSWTFTTNAAPVVRVISPAPGSVIRDRTPAIAFRAKDAEGKVSQRQVQVRVDGTSRPFTYRRGTGTLSPRLKRGRHTVLVTVTDAVGVSTTKEWDFRVRRR